jgi:hypothetical protein
MDAARIHERDQHLCCRSIACLDLMRARQQWRRWRRRVLRVQDVPVRARPLADLFFCVCACVEVSFTSILGVIGMCKYSYSVHEWRGGRLRGGFVHARAKAMSEPTYTCTCTHSSLHRGPSSSFVALLLLVYVRSIRTLHVVRAEVCRS